MATVCVPFTWSPSAVNSLQPILIVSSIAIVIHGIFWIQIILSSSLRQRNMMWLYVYLITDFLLISRFFILYSIRLAAMCLYPTSQNILCYFEASSKFYVDTVQSYLLLAFNVGRYMQIVYNQNIYTEKPRLIVLIHLLIYIIPALNVVVQFLTDWARLWRRRTGSCDILYNSLTIQLFNLFFTYIIPIVLGIIILGLGIRHVSSIRGVVSEQIILLRRKRQRTLLLQTIAFYTIWLILWSPDLLASQFVNVNSDPALFTSLLNCIEMALDPAFVAVLDIRFLKSWRTIWKRLKRHRQIGIAQKPPTIPRLGY
jgi:hypothetical protein